MDKSASLTTIARNILTSSKTLPADENIKSNKNTARVLKGWDTRRKNPIIKYAEDQSEGVHEARMVVRSIGKNLNNPSMAVVDYTKRFLLHKVRKLIQRKRPINAQKYAS